MKKIIPFKADKFSGGRCFAKILVLPSSERPTSYQAIITKLPPKS